MAQRRRARRPRPSPSRRPPVRPPALARPAPPRASPATALAPRHRRRRHRRLLLLYRRRLSPTLRTRSPARSPSDCAKRLETGGCRRSAGTPGGGGQATTRELASDAVQGRRRGTPPWGRGLLPRPLGAAARAPRRLRPRRGGGASACSRRGHSPRVSAAAVHSPPDAHASEGHPRRQCSARRRLRDPPPLVDRGEAGDERKEGEVGGG